MLEAKRQLAKLQARVDEQRRKVQMALAKTKKACVKIADAVTPEVASALRSVMQKNGASLDKLFMDVVKPGDERISPEAFSAYMGRLDGHSFEAQHLSLVCQQLEAGGLGRRRFAAFLQQYYSVAKSIALTDDFDISTAKSLRKVDLDEVLEVLEGPRVDSKLSVTRVRARALNDGQEGWITVKGNQGTPFLKEVDKPCYSCKKELELYREFDSADDAGLVRKLKSDEILELLQGPRKETYGPSLRIRAKAASDSTTGWLTTKDGTGTIFAEADQKMYTCTSAIAMTDDRDIKNCKVVRKLAAGEVFVAVERPVEEKDAGCTRVKCRSTKDDAVGWVTIKGNAGTVYAEASMKHYSILKEVPLQKARSSTSEQLRMLAVGEAMESLEGPREEATAPKVRVRCRAVSDGAEGWVTAKEGALRPWTPHYVCKRQVPFHKELKSEGAEPIRQIEVGEKLELLEGPVQEGDELRIKAEAVRDQAIGWVTVKGKEGKPFLES